MERKVVLVNNGPDANNVHVAGGSNAGIVVNKSHVEDDEDGEIRADHYNIALATLAKCYSEFETDYGHEIRHISCGLITPPELLAS